MKKPQPGAGAFLLVSNRLRGPHGNVLPRPGGPKPAWISIVAIGLGGTELTHLDYCSTAVNPPGEATRFPLDTRKARLYIRRNLLRPVELSRVTINVSPGSFFARARASLLLDSGLRARGLLHGSA